MNVTIYEQGVDHHEEKEEDLGVEDNTTSQEQSKRPNYDDEGVGEEDDNEDDNFGRKWKRDKSELTLTPVVNSVNIFGLVLSIVTGVLRLAIPSISKLKLVMMMRTRIRVHVCSFSCCVTVFC